jgi:hypothetical protein
MALIFILGMLKTVLEMLKTLGGAVGFDLSHLWKK